VKTLSRLLLIGLLFGVTGPVASAHGPKISFGFNFGIPLYGPYCHGHHYHHYPKYIVTQPVYVAQPVVVAPAPVAVPQPVIVPQPVVVPPSPVVKHVPVSVVDKQVTNVAATAQTVNWKQPGQGEELLQLLNDPDERIRSEAVIQLGRLKLDRAVDPLAATLAGDKSPLVRDAAARALGLIGASRALTALIYAAQADPDHDVRRSAQFAVEIIKLNHGLK
jgi:hypothetical protein